MSYFSGAHSDLPSGATAARSSVTGETADSQLPAMTMMVQPLSSKRKRKKRYSLEDIDDILTESATLRVAAAPLLEEASDLALRVGCSIVSDLTTMQQSTGAFTSTTGGYSNTDHAIVWTNDYEFDRWQELKRNCKNRWRWQQPEARGEDRWDKPKLPGERRRRIRRDKDAPEAPPEPPLTGYVVFVGQMTVKIRHDRPNVLHNQTAVVQEISKIWRIGMTDEEREYYTAFAEAVKKEYKVQDAEYRATGGYQPSKICKRVRGTGLWMHINEDEKSDLEREIESYESVHFPLRPPEMDEAYQKRHEQSVRRRRLKIRGLLNPDGTEMENADELLKTRKPRGRSRGSEPPPNKKRRKRRKVTTPPAAESVPNSEKQPVDGPDSLENDFPPADDFEDDFSTESEEDDYEACEEDEPQAAGYTDARSGVVVVAEDMDQFEEDLPVADAVAEDASTDSGGEGATALPEEAEEVAVAVDASTGTSAMVVDTAPAGNDSPAASGIDHESVTKCEAGQKDLDKGEKKVVVANTSAETTATSGSQTQRKIDRSSASAVAPDSAAKREEGQKDLTKGEKKVVVANTSAEKTATSGGQTQRKKDPSSASAIAHDSATERGERQMDTVEGEKAENTETISMSAGQTQRKKDPPSASSDGHKCAAELEEESSTKTTAMIANQTSRRKDPPLVSAAGHDFATELEDEQMDAVEGEKIDDTEMTAISANRTPRNKDPPLVSEAGHDASANLEEEQKGASEGEKTAVVANISADTTAMSANQSPRSKDPSSAGHDSAAELEEETIDPVEGEKTDVVVNTNNETTATSATQHKKAPPLVSAAGHGSAAQLKEEKMGPVGGGKTDVVANTNNETTAMSATQRKKDPPLVSAAGHDSSAELEEEQKDVLEGETTDVVANTSTETTAMSAHQTIWSKDPLSASAAGHDSAAQLEEEQMDAWDGEETDVVANTNTWTTAMSANQTQWKKDPPLVSAAGLNSAADVEEQKGAVEGETTDAVANTSTEATAIGASQSPRNTDPSSASAAGHDFAAEVEAEKVDAVWREKTDVVANTNTWTTVMSSNQTQWKKGPPLVSVAGLDPSADLEEEQKDAVEGETTDAVANTSTETTATNGKQSPRTKDPSSASAAGHDSAAEEGQKDAVDGQKTDVVAHTSTERTVISANQTRRKKDPSSASEAGHDSVAEEGQKDGQKTDVVANTSTETTALSANQTQWKKDPSSASAAGHDSAAVLEEEQEDAVEGETTDVVANTSTETTATNGKQTPRKKDPPPASRVGHDSFTGLAEGRKDVVEGEKLHVLANASTESHVMVVATDQRRKDHLVAEDPATECQDDEGDAIEGQNQDFVVGVESEAHGAMVATRVKRRRDPPTARFMALYDSGADCEGGEMGLDEDEKQDVKRRKKDPPAASDCDSSVSESEDSSNPRMRTASTSWTHGRRQRDPPAPRASAARRANTGARRRRGRDP